MKIQGINKRDKNIMVFLVKKILKLPKSLNVHFYGLNIINTYIYKLINRGKNVLKNFEIQFQVFETSPSASARKHSASARKHSASARKPSASARKHSASARKHSASACTHSASTRKRHTAEGLSLMIKGDLFLVKNDTLIINKVLKIA